MRKILWLCLALMVLEIIGCKSKEEDNDKPTKSLPGITGTIYANTNYWGLFEFDVSSGKWIKKTAPVPEHLGPAVTFHDNKMYFSEHDSDKIEAHKVDIQVCSLDSNENPRTLTTVEALPLCLSVSNDGGKLAYAMFVELGRIGLFLLDLSNNEKKLIYDANVISVFDTAWSSDDTSLFISVQNKIKKYSLKDGHQETVANGRLIEVFDNNTIGYLRYDSKSKEYVVYKKDILRDTEKEILRTKPTILYADWDPTEKFIIANCLSKFLIIRDLETEEEYVLPKLKYRAHRVYWESKKVE